MSQNQSSPSNVIGLEEEASKRVRLHLSPSASPFTLASAFHLPAPNLWTWVGLDTAYDILDGGILSSEYTLSAFDSAIETTMKCCRRHGDTFPYPIQFYVENYLQAIQELKIWSTAPVDARGRESKQALKAVQNEIEKIITNAIDDPSSSYLAAAREAQVDEHLLRRTGRTLEQVEAEVWREARIIVIGQQNNPAKAERQAGKEE
ncbi:hypothetical protein PMZ80_002231 [Knufia obscura]|uniref:Uncharacterized protein n=2 Tax=Knufia TaxID=430999 RepID=A0AAN8F3N0_9EURO|nr:hypothetical protein PMZ80_002231 [Knufia obscura]KAK5950591.1 hypothetical protein OHC33_008257 [Knufia fluminis]